MKKVLALTTTLALMGLNISAAQAEDVKGVNPWTDCGIGAMIFPTTPVGAVISNVIWDAGTTAVTSNISSQQTCEGEKVKMALFIEDSYKMLEEETANGQGQHITAMLNIAGCNASSHAEIIQSVRTNYSKVIAKLSAEKKPEAYYNTVSASITKCDIAS